MEDSVNCLLAVVNGRRVTSGTKRLSSLQWLVSPTFQTTLFDSLTPCFPRRVIAFRVYSHHLALSHAIHLSSLLEKGVVRTGISTELSEACTNWDRKHLLPDAVLDGLANRLGSGTGGDLWAHLDRARMQLAKREAEANNAK